MSASPLATPTPSVAATAASLNMTLYAHLDLTALAQPAHTDHDEGVEVVGAVSGSGNWGYTEGVHLLDVRNPERPQVLGYYDTYSGTSTGFNGAWGAYIFPGSDLILASDINGGLFLIGYTGR